MMPRRCAVTGATGFVGANLVCSLAGRGFSVRAAVRPSSSHPFLGGMPVELIPYSLSDPTSLKTLLTGCQWLFHAAALVRYNRCYLPELIATNVEGLRNVLQAAADVGVEKVIFVDSIAVFGASKSPHDVRDERAPFEPPNPVFAYTHSKVLGRRVVHELGAKVPIVTVYASPVYGAGDRYLHTGTLIKSLARFTPWLAPPGGTSTVAVDDLVEACLGAAERGRPGEGYIAASEQVSFLDLFNLILEVLGRRDRIRSVFPQTAYPAAFLAARVVDRLASRGISPYLIRNGFGYRYFSGDKARVALGWKPKVALRDAITASAAFLGIRSPMEPT